MRPAPFPTSSSSPFSSDPFREEGGRKEGAKRIGPSRRRREKRGKGLRKWESGGKERKEEEGKEPAKIGQAAPPTAQQGLSAPTGSSSFPSFFFLPAKAGGKRKTRMREKESEELGQQRYKDEDEEGPSP